MQRTTIMAPPELVARLRQMAAERGTSLADVVREALEEKSKTYRPRPRGLGIGASGFSDTARRIGEERPIPRSWR